ncbi:DUF948 domain-containing protein [Solibacillus sp. MA9]|uniref:DUF948 domain-containing protein n=1 Tax=Solibacillus palustris TaxID=2908203 RepID=A0ABS9UH95_9BACL|nr:DUF948 domain-containing protein [Solibacillus sp. MA9]
MNSWLLASVILLILAVVILIVCIIAVIMPIKKTMSILHAHSEGIQKQMNGIQTQTTLLAATAEKMKYDIEYKIETVQGVIQSLKNTGDVLNEISDSSQALTSKVMQKAVDDPVRQAQVEQWTNTAMGYLKRNG